MRSHGLADSPGRLGADGHACWSYEELAGDFRDAAVPFLAEGIELGQALMFVGGPAAEEAVRSIEPMSSMVADGSLEIAPFNAVYPAFDVTRPGGGRLPDPHQWSTYAWVTEQAVEGGFTGLRVLAEVTSLARTAGACADQALWESYADRRMPSLSLSAMCCYDRNVVPAEGLAAIASAHPVVDRRLGALTPFRVFGSADGAVAIAGEVDAFSRHTLDQLLRANGLEADRVVDLDDLTFIDHTGLLAVHQYAEDVRARGLTVTVRGGSPSVHRLADLLRITL